VTLLGVLFIINLADAFFFVLPRPYFLRSKYNLYSFFVYSLS